MGRHFAKDNVGNGGLAAAASCVRQIGCIRIKRFYAPLEAHEENPGLVLLAIFSGYRWLAIGSANRRRRHRVILRETQRLNGYYYHLGAQN